MVRIGAEAPVSALSANVLSVHLAECRDAGMDDHIAKPISPGEPLIKVGLWTQTVDPEPLLSAAI
jgi:CheY-like chemotaxis protein